MAAQLTWGRGSLPPSGEYEFNAITGGRVRVWVTQEGSVVINGEIKEFDEIFAIGKLIGPIEE